MAVKATMDIWTILEGTGEVRHLDALVNLRIREAGGVDEEDLDHFVFQILGNLETGLREKVKGKSHTSGDLKEKVHETIEEMMKECDTENDQ